MTTEFRTHPLLVGREPALGELRRAVGQAAAGSGSLVLVGGEPGIGKTRLAQHAAADAELGAHLQVSVRTGTFCVYRPDPGSTITWDVA